MKKSLITIFLFLQIIVYLNADEQEGTASWYGPNFHGKKTANGEIFNTNDYTAAHRTFPFNSIVKVTSLENSKSTIVRINDRGPFAHERIIDLSLAAATDIDMIKNGVMKVKVELIEKGDNKYHRFGDHNYRIQIASFTELKNAEKFIENLKNNLYNAEVEKVEKDKTLYRVFIDNLNYSELQLLRVKLNKSGINNYLVIKKKK